MGARIELETDNYILRSMSESDVTETYLSWMQDYEVTRTLDVDGDNQTIETLKDYVRSHISKGDYVFGIYTKKGKHIGTHSFVWSKANKVAQIGVMIGDRTYWGKGVPLETRSRLLNYAFDLGCKKIEASCDSINIPAIYNFVKQGWNKEGVRKAHRIVDNKPVDLILFGMLDYEWNAKRK
jgi:[ribosomal protein S5]-alanine N-acetyltransferase